MTDRYTFLGMPGYGKQTADAGRALWRASRDMGRVCVSYRQGSLLAANFNGLWVTALNMQHQGERVDYFAMLHDDFGPQDWWLDTLIDELESRELDVLGVVAPIKDGRGLTSIALDEPGETWKPHCRLTMSEVYRLPETFTSEDVGRPLLLNTGCWVCRFDPFWVKKVHFTVKDRIAFNRATNSYVAQVEPEDWYFSRLLHELKLKVGCTRKITATHRGEHDFTNARPWGDHHFDMEYTTESPVPETQDGFRFPHDVDGWLTETEGRALAELAKDRYVLEIGSYCGRSTICLAQTATHVTAIDPHDGRGTPRPKETRDEMEANLRRYGVSNSVSIFSPHRFAEECDNDHTRYTIAFIDGAHDYESVKHDIDLCLSMLRPDGLLAFHDYRDAGDPGVRQAVDELLSDGGELLSRHDSLAVVRPPSRIPELTS